MVKKWSQNIETTFFLSSANNFSSQDLGAMNVGMYSKHLQKSTILVIQRFQHDATIKTERSLGKRQE
jgi:hypothetical protein